MKKLFALLLIVGLSMSAFAQKETLRYNLKNGETYSMNAKAKMLMKQDMGFTKMEMGMDMDISYSFLVKGKSGEIYDLEIKYTRMVMEMNTPQGKMTIDASNPNASDPTSQVLKGFLDSPFMVKMDTRGQILEVNGLDEMMNNILKNMNLPASQKEVLAAQLSQSYGQESFKQNMSNNMPVFPENAVSPGETWETTLKLNTQFFPIDIKATYTYKGVENGAWLIDGKADMAMKGSQNANGMDIEYDLTSDMVYNQKLDKSTGWPKDTNAKMNMKGEFKVPASNELPNGMTIPMEMTMEMTMK